MPDLSVVIPARNEEQRIGEQLRSLLSQSWDHEWEVVVVDNGSTDRTADVVREFMRHEPRLRLVTASDRFGLSYVRNFAMSQVTSDRVAFVDADDVVSPGWLAAMGSALLLHPYVSGPNDVTTLNTGYLSESRGRRPRSAPNSFLGVFEFAGGNNLGLWRSTWEQAGRFLEDAQTLEDIEFGMRVWLKGIPLYFANEAVVSYRYRTTCRELWKQGLFYGRGRVHVCKQLRDAGVRGLSRASGWHSWAWLLIHFGNIVRRDGRRNWVWVAANRLGQVLGSASHRSVWL